MTWPSVNQVVAANVRRLRAAADMSQERLALRLRTIGLDWGRSQVAMVESGRRGVGLADGLALAHALDVPLVELLRSDDDRVTADGEATWSADFLIGLVDGSAGDVPAHRAVRGAMGEAELATALRMAPMVVANLMKAAQARWPSLGEGTAGERESRMTAGSAIDAAAARRMERRTNLTVKPWEIVEAARELWGRTYEAERDARVLSRTETATPRTLQALRGHVSRQLDDELEIKIEEAATRAAATSGDER